MTVQALSSTTRDTLANYQHAATAALGAYRTGTHRLVGAVQRGVQRQLVPQAVKLAPQVGEVLGQGSQNMAEAVLKGVELIHSKGNQVLDAGYKAVFTQLQRATDIALSLDNRYLSYGLNLAADLTLPRVQTAHTVSTYVVKGVDALSSRVGSSVAAEVAAAATRVRRASRSAKAAAPKAASQVAKAVSQKAKAVGNSAGKVQRSVRAKARAA